MEPDSRHPYSLEDGEQLLWHGGPREGVVWWRVALMVPWLFYFLLVTFGRHSLLEKAFSATMAAVYLVLIVLALWLGRRGMRWRKQWMYRLTNRRVVVQMPKGTLSPIIHNVPLGDIGDFQVCAAEKGLSTVVIGYGKQPQTLSDGTRVLGELAFVSLTAIADAQEVSALIESARKNATSSPTEAGAPVPPSSSQTSPAGQDPEYRESDSFR